MKKKVEAFKPADEITVDDCIVLYEQKGYAAICNNGKLEGFMLDSQKNKAATKNLKFIWLNSQ